LWRMNVPFSENTFLNPEAKTIYEISKEVFFREGMIQNILEVCTLIFIC